jgi:hypothetical protein
MLNKWMLLTIHSQIFFKQTTSPYLYISIHQNVPLSILAILIIRADVKQHTF